MTDIARLNPVLAATVAPPVMEARRWLAGVSFPPGRPLINVSQAAPVDPPPMALRQAMAEAALNRPEAHLYGPVLGNADLRGAVAAEFSRSYGGAVAPAQVAITQGCNQAFCAAITTLAQAGDQVILPTPWYFNHKMWLDMQGIQAVPLPCGDDLLPDPDLAARLIGPRCRAIVLVTPNNPSVAEYPADLVARFFDLAQSRGLALILDETYRDFDSRSGLPHDLLTRPGWDRTVIQLYSFSKAYRLTGHRVGALIASEWWPDAPDDREWAEFVRGAGFDMLPAPEASAAPDRRAVGDGEPARLAGGGTGRNPVAPRCDRGRAVRRAGLAREKRRSLFRLGAASAGRILGRSGAADGDGYRRAGAAGNHVHAGGRSRRFPPPAHRLCQYRHGPDRCPG